MAPSPSMQQEVLLRIQRTIEKIMKRRTGGSGLGRTGLIRLVCHHKRHWLGHVQPRGLLPSLGRRRRRAQVGLCTWSTLQRRCERLRGPVGATEHWGEQNPPRDPSKMWSQRCCSDEPKARAPPARRGISHFNPSFQQTFTIFTLFHLSSGFSVLYFEKLLAPFLL